jgi:hypothetical protein
MADTQRVRFMPEYHLLPDWLLDPITLLLSSLGVMPHYNNNGVKITAADATDLATLKTLTKALSDGQVVHGLDTGIHSAADAAMDEPAGYASSPSEPADLAECVSVLNQLKADLNLHLLNVTPHRGVLGLAAVTSAQAVIDSLVNSGILPHFGQPPATDLVTAAAATDLATLKTLIKDLSDTFVLHGLSTISHSAVDAALDEPAEFTSSPSEPADLAECQATNNQLKADLNTHIANATPHRGVGGQAALTVAQIATTDGIDQATNETLADALKAAYNLHAQMGAFDAVGPDSIAGANAMDQVSAELLANAYKAAFNIHCDLGFADFLVD